MGLSNNTARVLLESSGVIQPTAAADPVWLTIGTVDYFTDYDLVQGYGFTNADAHARHDQLTAHTPAKHASSKNLCADFAAHLGYNRYLELDINDRADIRHDLNHPIPGDLKGQFDLVWDAGSVEHVMNITQALFNLIDLVKLDGKIIHTQLIGDQTNAGYWTFSPNFFTDFYQANGFRALKLILYNRRGYALDYHETRRKHTRIGYLLPIPMALAYYVRMAREDIVTKLLERYRTARRAYKLMEGLPIVGDAVNHLIGKTQGGKCDWEVLAIFQKVQEVEGRASLIQNIYRGEPAPVALNTVSEAW